MRPEVIIVSGDKRTRIELSAGTLARLSELVKHYGSLTAVIEAGVEMLAKVETNPNLSAGAKQRLRTLASQLSGSETAVVEMGLEYLAKLVEQGYIETKDKDLQ